jgi:Ca2+-binding RTX toxin-like protein
MRGITGIRGIRGIKRTPAIVTGLGVAALAVAGVSLSAATASAQTPATVRADDGGHAIYVTGGDADNDVTITSEFQDNGTEEFVIDDVVPITPGEGCVYADESDTTQVVCTLTEFGDYWVAVNVELGDGDDALMLDTGNINGVHGGPGDDRLDTPLGDGITYGDEGNDSLTGGTLHGGPGNDTVEPRGLHYAAYGDDGNDHLMDADNRAQSMYGGRGDDTIHALAGNDVVYGNSGEDEIRGGTGADELSGGPDDDTLYGNSGNDVLHGGPGTDQLSGGPGTDQVHQD